MSETYEFVEATPVARPGRVGAGRRREANPFEEAVKAIVGQVDSQGQPVARSTTFTLDAEHGETLKQRTARIRRLLTRAGKEVVSGGQEPATIKMDISEKSGTPGVYVVTFWHRQG